MKKDIKTYRYGIIVPDTIKGIKRKQKNIMNYLTLNNQINDAKKNSYVEEFLCETLFNNKNIIIDFKSIDGLVLKDLEEMNLIKEKAIIFVMYDKIKYYDRENESIEEKIQLIPKYFHVIDVESFNKDTEINDIVEKELKKEIAKKDSNFYRRVKCFIKRYGNEDISEEQIKEKY